jgi:hypothetical protein
MTASAADHVEDEAVTLFGLGNDRRKRLAVNLRPGGR